MEEDRSKDTNSAGGENDEQKTNSQANVVFPVRGFASDGFRVSFIGFTVSRARLVVGGGLEAREDLLNTSVEMAVLGFASAVCCVFFFIFMIVTFLAFMVMVFFCLGTLSMDSDIFTLRVDTEPKTPKISIDQ